MSKNIKKPKKIRSLLLFAALLPSVLVITYITSPVYSSSNWYDKKYSAKWTTKADFESNASTVKKPTTISNIEVSGINPSDDSSLSLKKETATSYYNSGTVSRFKIYSGSYYYGGYWDEINWNSIKPPGWEDWWTTGVNFRYRTANNENKLNSAAWSPYDIYASQGSHIDIVNRKSRWLELEVMLISTPDSLATPSLNDFSVEYYKLPLSHSTRIKLSVRPKKRVIRAGQTVVFRGQLLNALNEGIPNKKIKLVRRIYRRKYGWSRLYPLAAVRTNAKGKFVKKLRVKRSSIFQMIYWGSGYWYGSFTPKILKIVKK